jgi:excisionase family DNA binding protein
MATSTTAPRRTLAATALIDVPTLAQRLGIQVSFVRKLVDQRRIPFVRIGRLIRFDPDEVGAWLASNRVEAVGRVSWSRSQPGGPRT